MADETIVRVCGTNVLPGSTNVKLPIESGNNRDFAGKKQTRLKPGQIENRRRKIEAGEQIEWYWR